MKHLARIVLRLATVGIPVFIAACYGMPARYNRQGKVIDRDTHAPITGIKVSCVLSTGEAINDTYSGEDGSFYLYSDDPCASLAAEDVDGVQNGSYQKTSVVLENQNPSSSSGEVTIQMGKAQ